MSPLKILLPFHLFLLCHLTGNHDFFPPSQYQTFSQKIRMRESRISNRFLRQPEQFFLKRKGRSTLMRRGFVSGTEERSYISFLILFLSKKDALDRDTWFSFCALHPFCRVLGKRDDRKDGGCTWRCGQDGSINDVQAVNPGHESGIHREPYPSRASRMRSPERKRDKRGRINPCFGEDRTSNRGPACQLP